MKVIVLGIMLLSSSPFALADTKKVDAEHLRAHRDFEQKNLEQKRYKLEATIGDPNRNEANFRFGKFLVTNRFKKEDDDLLLPANPVEDKSTWGFAQFQLNQSGMPLQSNYHDRFKCEPSFSKSWKDYDNPYIQRGFESENSESSIIPNQRQQSSVDLKIVAP